MSKEPINTGMTSATARKLEYSIIALGIIALLLIFQPFNISLFAIGAILVVIAGLVNNLLPLAHSGVQIRSVITVALVVAMIFCITLLLSIFVAYLYGSFFLQPPNPATVAGKAMLAATPWYMSSFTWTIAALAIVFASLVTLSSRRAK